MALPTQSDLQTLKYAYQGQPFNQISAINIDTSTLKYAYQGQPFNYAPGPTYDITKGFFLFM